jgi:hypothetical protein
VLECAVHGWLFGSTGADLLQGVRDASLTCLSIADCRRTRVAAVTRRLARREREAQRQYRRCSQRRGALLDTQPVKEVVRALAGGASTAARVKSRDVV